MAARSERPHGTRHRPREAHSNGAGLHRRTADSGGAVAAAVRPKAWYRNDTKLMAWVLEQAACAVTTGRLRARSSAALPGQLEPTGTGTPPLIRALLGGGYSDALGVAFHQSGPRTDWISNDSFDQRVCSRRALHDASCRHVL